MNFAYDYCDAGAVRSAGKDESYALIIPAGDPQSAWRQTLTVSYSKLMELSAECNRAAEKKKDLLRIDNSLRPLENNSPVRSLSAHKRLSRRLALDAKSLEQFSFIISHRLRAPIANALGLVELLDSGFITENERQNCQRLMSIAVKEIDVQIRAMNDVLNNHWENAVVN